MVPHTCIHIHTQTQVASSYTFVTNIASLFIHLIHLCNKQALTQSTIQSPPQPPHRSLPCNKDVGMMKEKQLPDLISMCQYDILYILLLLLSQFNNVLYSFTCVNNHTYISKMENKNISGMDNFSKNTNHITLWYYLITWECSVYMHNSSFLNTWPLCCKMKVFASTSTAKKHQTTCIENKAHAHHTTNTIK